MPEAERLDAEQLVDDLRARGQQARHIPEIHAIVDTIVREHQVGDVVVLMSNGGFGGIHRNCCPPLQRNRSSERLSRIRDAGDSALLLEWEEVIDPRVNGQAIAVAAAIRGATLPGVRDVVSTYRSVAVFFDPLNADPQVLREALTRFVATPLDVVRGHEIEVPVTYGGETGPDLSVVAEWAGLSTGEVAQRHADVEYRVFMLGFLPGFGYLGSVDDRIAAPRRDTPRLRVPIGSVGIAGKQSGIYPRASPGGWQIIG